MTWHVDRNSTSIYRNWNVIQITSLSTSNILFLDTAHTYWWSVSDNLQIIRNRRLITSSTLRKKSPYRHKKHPVDYKKHDHSDTSMKSNRVRARTRYQLRRQTWTDTYAHLSSITKLSAVWCISKIISILETRDSFSEDLSLNQTSLKFRFTSNSIWPSIPDLNHLYQYIVS